MNTSNPPQTSLNDLKNNKFPFYSIVACVIWKPFQKECKNSKSSCYFCGKVIFKIPHYAIK